VRTDRLPRPLERNEQARAPQWVEKSRGLCAHAPPRTSPVFDPFGPRGAAEEKGGADAAPRRATAATGSAGAASSGGGAARAGALRESPPPPRPAAEEASASDETDRCGAGDAADDASRTALSAVQTMMADDASRVARGEDKGHLPELSYHECLWRTKARLVMTYEDLAS
jgi:hypothetical protein